MESIDIKNKINFMRAIVPQFKAGKNSDILKIAESSPKLKKSLERAYPELKEIFYTDVTNTQSAERLLLKLVNKASVQNDVVKSSDDIKRIFYNVYSWVTKIFMAHGILSIVLGNPGGLSFILMIAVISTLVIYLNISKHDMSLKQAINNFKKSFNECMKKSLPTNAERNLAFIPLFLLTFLILIFPMSGIMTAFFGGYAAMGIISSAGYWMGYCLYTATVLHLFCNLLDEWILRKGWRESP